MRWIEKQKEPQTLTDTRCAPTTDLSTLARARTAFNQLDKGHVRERLAVEQGSLCAFCMRRIDATATDERGEPTMKIAHRTPISVDPSAALTWANLLGSCDGGQRMGGRRWTCDAAQGAAPLTVDPTNAHSVARLRYERRPLRQGLFITSDDAAIRADVDSKEQPAGAPVPGALALNSGDLPGEREAAWKAFLKDYTVRYPKGPYGKEAWRQHLPKWRGRRAASLPEWLGVIEAKLG